MKQDVSDTASYQAMVSSMAKVEHDRSASFPAMLHRMLADIEELGRKDPEMGSLKKIVSWQPHGKAFKIHDRKKFVSVVMPVWFMRIKYTSWIRQLNTYGFKKVHEDGPDKGALYHESFLRGMPDLATQVQKIPKKKQHQVAASSSCSHAQFLPVPNKVGESSSLPSLPPLTGRHYIMTGAMQQHRLSVGSGQTSLQAQIQAQDALVSSLIPSRRVSATGSACTDSTSLEGCSSNDVLGGTFGRVWHLLDESHDDDLLRSNPLPCSTGGIGNAANFADMEPLPFSTELTVTEKWGDRDTHQFSSSLFIPQQQFS